MSVCEFGGNFDYEISRVVCISTKITLRPFHISHAIFCRAISQARRAIDRSQIRNLSRPVHTGRRQYKVPVRCLHGQWRCSQLNQSRYWHCCRKMAVQQPCKFARLPLKAVVGVRTCFSAATLRRKTFRKVATRMSYDV